jgi:hypothetical protein
VNFEKRGAPEAVCGQGASTDRAAPSAAVIVSPSNHRDIKSKHHGERTRTRIKKLQQVYSVRGFS